MTSFCWQASVAKMWKIQLKPDLKKKRSIRGVSTKTKIEIMTKLLRGLLIY